MKQHGPGSSPPSIAAILRFALDRQPRVVAPRRDGGSWPRYDCARHGVRAKAYPLLTSLLDGILGRSAPPFVLSKLEGGAVFAFAAEGEQVVRR
jgi:hypothetical protein